MSLHSSHNILVNTVPYVPNSCPDFHQALHSQHKCTCPVEHIRDQLDRVLKEHLEYFNTINVTLACFHMVVALATLTKAVTNMRTVGMTHQDAHYAPPPPSFLVVSLREQCTHTQCNKPPPPYLLSTFLEFTQERWRGCLKGYKWEKMQNSAPLFWWKNLVLPSCLSVEHPYWHSTHKQLTFPPLSQIKGSFFYLVQRRRPLEIHRFCSQGAWCCMEAHLKMRKYAALHLGKQTHVKPQLILLSQAWKHPSRKYDTQMLLPKLNQWDSCPIEINHLCWDR